jgi:hypothetical protein
VAESELNKLRYTHGVCPALLRIYGVEERDGELWFPWLRSNGEVAWHVWNPDKPPGEQWRWVKYPKDPKDLKDLRPFRLQGESQDRALVCESERDAFALLAGLGGSLTVFATGGAGMWKDWWREELEPFQEIICWIEDKASLGLLRALKRSAPPGKKIRVVANWGSVGDQDLKDAGRILGKYYREEQEGQKGRWEEGCEYLRDLIEKGTLTLETVSSKEDLPDVIADRLEELGHKLGKPNGKGDRKALCIFHEERKPSLSFGPEGFHCFGLGCGQSGKIEELGAMLGVLVEGEVREERGEEKGPRLTLLANVQAESAEWLWEPYIPFGKITFIDGDPGVGKSWLSVAICSIASQGWPFPGQDGESTGIVREPHNVIYLCLEDGLADTIRPRVDALGGDPERIFVLQEGTITLGDIDKIEEWIQETGARLLLFDPLQSVLGKIDMFRANETRSLLEPLAKLAEKYRVAVIITRHLTKHPTDRSIYRGMGSIDFAAIARSVLLVGLPPGAKSNCPERIIAQVKNNFAPKGKSISFEIKEGQFFWKGFSEFEASDLLRPELGGEKKSALEKAVEFLKEELAEGPVPSKELFKKAEAERISGITLKRAKSLLGVKPKKLREGWVSILPKEDQEEDHAPVHCYDPLKNYPQSLENTNTSARRSKGSCDPIGTVYERQKDHVIPLKKDENSNDSDDLENNFKRIKTVNNPLDPLPPTPSPARSQGPKRDAVSLELPFGKSGDIWDRVRELIGDLPPEAQESLIQRFRERPEALLNLKRVEEVCYFSGVNERQYPPFGNEGAEEDVEAILHVRD